MGTSTGNDTSHFFVKLSVGLAVTAVRGVALSAIVWFKYKKSDDGGGGCENNRRGAYGPLYNPLLHPLRHIQYVPEPEPEPIIQSHPHPAAAALIAQDERYLSLFMGMD